MTRILLTTLAFLSLDAGLYLAFSAEPTAAELLQGSWEVIAIERSGQNDPWQVGATLTIAGDEVGLDSRVMLVPDGAERDPLQVGPAAAPRILDGTS